MSRCYYCGAETSGMHICGVPTTTLPGCMMPDGAEPCKAYQELRSQVETLWEQLKDRDENTAKLISQVAALQAENDRLRGLLEVIDSELFRALRAEFAK